MKELLQVVGIIVIIGGISIYTYHIWSDCLNENSVITCVRMLSK